MNEEIQNSTKTIKNLQIMDIIEHFEHHSRKQDKEHFGHLIQIALADGIVDATETEMLQKLGRKIGFTEDEILDLIETSKKDSYAPSTELSKRFEQMYDLVKMVLADGKIDNAEMRLTTSFAIKSGFNENEIPGLLNLLIDGIKNNEDEDDLFIIYKKKIMKIK